MKKLLVGIILVLVLSVMITPVFSPSYAVSDLYVEFSDRPNTSRPTYAPGEEIHITVTDAVLGGGNYIVFDWETDNRIMEGKIGSREANFTFTFNAPSNAGSYALNIQESDPVSFDVKGDNANSFKLECELTENEFATARLTWPKENLQNPRIIRENLSVPGQDFEKDVPNGMYIDSQFADRRYVYRVIADNAVSNDVYITVQETMASGLVGVETDVIILRKNDPEMYANNFESLGPIDGDRGTKPLEVNDRLLVPLRAIIERMGGDINWNERSETVSIRFKDLRLVITIGETKYTVDDVTSNTELEVPARLENDRTFIPVRGALDALGCEIKYDDKVDEVIIKYLL
jgi:hypothetical protein